MHPVVPLLKAVIALAVVDRGFVHLKGIRTRHARTVLMFAARFGPGLRTPIGLLRRWRQGLNRGFVHLSQFRRFFHRLGVVHGRSIRVEDREFVHLSVAFGVSSSWWTYTGMV